MRMLACKTHGKKRKCLQDFSVKNLVGRDHLQDLDIDGRIILKQIEEAEWKSVDCSYLASCSSCYKHGNETLVL
jgi:hypothetical protein